MAPAGLDPSISLQRWFRPGGLTSSLCPGEWLGAGVLASGAPGLRPGSASFKLCGPEKLLNLSVPRSPHL